MNLNDYQNQAMRTAQYPNIGSNVIYPVLGLVGEAGEVANKLKKQVRRPCDAGDIPEVTRRKMELADELGDALWHLSVSAWEIGYTLEEIADLNLSKLATRAASGTLTSTETRDE